MPTPSLNPICACVANEFAPPHLLDSDVRSEFFGCGWRGGMWYRAGAGDPGQRLADPLVFRSAGRLPTKCIAVVGTAGWRGAVSLFGDDLNDGFVAIDEAVPADPWQLVQVPALHTFLMNAAPVRSLICRELA